jgi:hypothetical protein
MGTKKLSSYYFTMKQDHYGRLFLIVPCSITTNFNNAKFPILLEMSDGFVQRRNPFRRFKGWAWFIHSRILCMGFVLMLPIYGLNNLMRFLFNFPWHCKIIFISSLGIMEKYTWDCFVSYQHLLWILFFQPICSIALSSFKVSLLWIQKSRNM